MATYALSVGIMDGCGQLATGRQPPCSLPANQRCFVKPDGRGLNYGNLAAMGVAIPGDQL